jgi:hypothetical protein
MNSITKSAVLVAPGNRVSTLFAIPSMARRGETAEQLLERCVAKALQVMPPGTTWFLTQISALPLRHRVFSDAWTVNEGHVLVDMARAREVHRAKLRKAREAELARLDVEYQRADETGNTIVKGQLTLAKQALRDLPQDPAIELAMTPDQLKAAWPAVLPNPY